MEIISKINTDKGMELKLKINGEVIQKTFSYEELDAFVRKERKAEMKKNREMSDDEQPSKRQRR